MGEAMDDKQPFDAEHYVDTTAAAVGLPIPPESRAAVVATFRQIADMASLVMSFPIDDDIDPATVFRP